MCRWYPSETSACLRSVFRTSLGQLCFYHTNMLLCMASGDFGEPGLAVAKLQVKRL